MGYEIFTDHRLESLVGGRLDLFRSGFFGPRPAVVVQNQSLAQWLKLFLARSSGGYATGDLLFQDGLLRRLIEGSLAADDRVLFLDDLKFAVYRRLSVLLRDPEPVFAPLAPDGPPDPARLFELADHVAGVFHNYAMNSRIWPRALSEGVLPPDSGAEPGAFAWQSRLWRDLWSATGGTLAGLVLDRLTRNPPAPSAPPLQVILVGSAFLSRRAAAFLGAWAEAGLVDVVHLLLLPAPVPGPSGWPGTRPWSSWGAFGRTFLDLLPVRLEAGPTPVTPEDGPALGGLQGALARGLPVGHLVPDATLEVVSAPHPLAELEVVRDRLLAALADDPTLEVHEIAVLAPDINVYAPFLEAAFSSDDPGRHLRHHVIDLDLGRENPWFRALDALLSLVSGTIDRPTLFTLVDTPAFREAWSVENEDRDLWLDYTQEVSAWREEPFEGSGVQSWTASWDRLFGGWFRSEGGPAPGLDTSPSAFRSLGVFHQVLETLGSLGRETRRDRGFAEWIRFLDQTVAAFLAPGDGTCAVLSGRLRTLVHDAGEPADPLPWAGFRAFVQDQIAHFPGRRGQLLTEGIHCSSLRPLRAIPFRVIAVVGLDEGRFPRQTPTPSFDLMRHEPDQEGLSGLALDRYCFWETLMAARSRLILSWQGRSPVDGTERPPSPVLADLLDYLEEGGSPWPVTRGPVKDFAPASGQAPTWSARTRRRAEAVAGRQEAPDTSPAAPAPNLAEVFPEVRSSEVVQAFTAPARFHLRRVRQVVLKDEDRRGVDEEEPWSLSFLDRQGWLLDGLRRQLSGLESPWDAAAFLERSVAVGRVRAGVFTDRDLRDLERRAAEVSAWATELADAGWTVPPASPSRRTRWAGRPWAPEPDGRLVRGSEVLLPRLLWAETLPVRGRFEAALGLLQDPAPAARLATLAPSGAREEWEWTLDPPATAALAARAEGWWALAASRPLGLYPDYLEALARRRQDLPDEDWAEAVEQAWVKARIPGYTRSEATLGRDPYAALVFPGDEVPPTLARDTADGWDDLFLPLLGAWS